MPDTTRETRETMAAAIAEADRKLREYQNVFGFDKTMLDQEVRAYIRGADNGRVVVTQNGEIRTALLNDLKTECDQYMEMISSIMLDKAEGCTKREVDRQTQLFEESKVVMERRIQERQRRDAILDSYEEIAFICNEITQRHEDMLAHIKHTKRLLEKCSTQHKSRVNEYLREFYRKAHAGRLQHTINMDDYKAWQDINERQEETEQRIDQWKNEKTIWERVCKEYVGGDVRL